MRDVRSSFARFLEEETRRLTDGDMWGSIVDVVHRTDLFLHNRMPNKLYRFRDGRFIDREIEDIKQGVMFLPFARSFNDIKDGVVFLDKEAVANQIEEQLTPARFTKMMDERIASNPDRTARVTLRLYKRKTLAAFDESRASFISEMLDSYEDACRGYRNGFRIACLTENLGSTSMWGLYAASGTGYCIEYDLEAQVQLRCSCRNGCCRSEVQLLPIFPVIYDGQFDATLLSHVVLNKHRNSQLPTAGDYLAQINALVHKTQNWSAEGEWRVIASDCEDKVHSLGGKMYANLKASAVYLGYNISEEDEEKFRRLRRDIRIPLFRVEDDNSSPTSTFRYLPVVG